MSSPPITIEFALRLFGNNELKGKSFFFLCELLSSRKKAEKIVSLFEGNVIYAHNIASRVYGNYYSCIRLAKRFKGRAKEIIDFLDRFPDSENAFAFLNSSDSVSLLSRNEPFLQALSSTNETNSLTFNQSANPITSSNVNTVTTSPNTYQELTVLKKEPETVLHYNEIDLADYFGNDSSAIEHLKAFCESQKFALLYDSNTNEKTSQSFHQCCDSVANTVTIVFVDSFICGGIATSAWNSNNYAVKDFHARLFTLKPKAEQFTVFDDMATWALCTLDELGPSFGCQAKDFQVEFIQDNILFSSEPDSFPLEKPLIELKENEQNKQASRLIVLKIL